MAVCYEGGEKIIIAKPLTFMNLSGVAVKQLLKKYKAEPKDLLVLYDDLDIPAASIRVRMRGAPERTTECAILSPKSARRTSRG